MANGAGSPDCFNCNFFSSKENNKYCTKHNFFIPQTGGSEKLCSDYLSRKNHSKSQFSSLSSGILYRYLSQSMQVPEPLAPFDHFQKPIEYFISPLTHDSEYGWSLYLWHPYHKYFPTPGGKYTLNLNGSDCTFEITDAERMHFDGAERREDDTWNAKFTKHNQRILFSPTAPDILYKWLDFYFDAEKLLARQTEVNREISAPVNIFTLFEADLADGVIALHPDILMYGEFGRGDYKRGRYDEQSYLFPSFPNKKSLVDRIKSLFKRI